LLLLFKLALASAEPGQRCREFPFGRKVDLHYTADQYIGSRDCKAADCGFQAPTQARRVITIAEANAVITHPSSKGTPLANEIPIAFIRGYPDLKILSRLAIVFLVFHVDAGRCNTTPKQFMPISR
jgi:hypothetical protein